MSESLVIDFLYGTRFGRFLLKGLVNPTVSEIAARYLSSPASTGMIPAFVKKHKIDMNEYEIPEGGFQSFNEFFTRRIKPGKRTIGRGRIISPCDGYLTISHIDNDSIFYVKKTAYSLKGLLRSETLARRFTGGTAFIFRLTPAHYHRFVFCTSGEVASSRKIKGILHSVKPICHEKFPVFIQNSREYAIIRNEMLGSVIQMEVGALLVGRISNRRYVGCGMVSAGDEKGFFEYGGSSVIVITKCRLGQWDGISARTKIGGEVSVKMGEVIL